MSFDVHGSYEINKGIIPEGVTVTHHPYDGTPFSSYYILSKGDKVIPYVYFGCGGWYPDVAAEKLKQFFSSEKTLEEIC